MRSVSELCKAFPYSILVSELERNGFDGWMDGWSTQGIQDWLDGCRQSLVGSSLWSLWRSVTGRVSEGLVLLSSSVGDTDSGIEAPSVVTPSCVPQSHAGGRGWIQGHLDRLGG